MKFRNNLKRFFTLDRHHAEGFTLVELIVVIAILAILAGVAVPAYSGYVTQTNKQADITLVSDVAYALQLHYYSNPTAAADGYVILNYGADAEADEAGVGEAAMKKAFGENWKKTATLKCSDWTDGGILDYVLSHQDTAGMVADSTYLTKCDPSKLVATISTVTDSLAEMMDRQTVDPLNKLVTMGFMSSEDVAEIRTGLADDYDLAWSDEGDNAAYTTAVSNALVNYVAKDLGSMGPGNMPSEMAMLALNYGSVYAWASTDPAGADVLAQMDAAINGDGGAEAVSDAIYAGLQDQRYQDYTTEHNDVYNADMMAMLKIMGAVGDITDGLSMTEKGLYSSATVAGMVHDYTTAIKTVNAMLKSGVDLNGLDLAEGSVAVFVDASGSVNAIPSVAFMTQGE